MPAQRSSCSRVAVQEAAYALATGCLPEHGRRCRSHQQRQTSVPAARPIPREGNASAMTTLAAEGLLSEG